MTVLENELFVLACLLVNYIYWVKFVLLKNEHRDFNLPTKYCKSTTMLKTNVWTHCYIKKIVHLTYHTNGMIDTTDVYMKNLLTFKDLYGQSCTAAVYK